MNAKRWMGMVAIAGFMTGVAFAGEDYYVVKVIGADRKAEIMCIPKAEYKTLEKTIKLEQKYFPKAVSLVAKEWKADESNKGSPYPGAKLAPRTIMSAQSFPSQEKADAQITRMSDQDEKREKRLANKKSNKKHAKSKNDEAREAELTRASDMVQSKLEELVAKGGTPEKASSSEVEAGGAKVGAEVENK